MDLDAYVIWSAGPAPDLASLWAARPSLAASDQFGAEAGFLGLYIAAETALRTAPRWSLTTQTLVPAASGLYLIYYDDDLVYLGSTDHLRQRLREHRTSVQQAGALDVGRARYGWLICGKHAAKAIEGCLIAHYAPAWNTGGFGNHVVGKSRQGQARSAWDIQFNRVR